jgi:hypothetical protein
MSEEKPIEQMSVEEAKTEIDRRLEDFESPYWVNEHPGHRRAVDEMRRLHEVAFPQRGAEGHNGLAEKLENEGVTEDDLKRAEKSLEDLQDQADDQEEIPLTPEQEEGFKKLKAEWGNTYEEKLDQARMAYEGIVQTYAKDNEEFKTLMENSLGNEPCIIKLFSKFAEEGREAAQSITCPHCGKPITAEKED